MSNVSQIEDLYKAFAAGDVPTVLGAMAPDIEWHEAEGLPYGGVYNSPQQVLENVFMKLMADWDGFGVVPDEFLDAGRQVVALGHYSGVSKTSGKSMKVPFAHVWWTEDGKISKFKQFTDTAKFIEAL